MKKPLQVVRVQGLGVDARPTQKRELCMYGLISGLVGMFNVRKDEVYVFHPFIFWSINSQVADKVTVRRCCLGTDDKVARTGSAAATKRMTWEARVDEKD